MALTGRLCALALSLAAPLAAQTVHVTGTVTASGTPVANAQVRIGSTTLVSDAAGRFAADLGQSNVEIIVDPPAGSGLLQTRLQNVPIDRDMQLRVLMRRPVRISGRVAVTEGVGLPSLELWSLTSERHFSFGAPGNGEFMVEVPSDVYAVYGIARFPLYRIKRVNVDARNGDVFGLNIEAPVVDETLLPPAPPVAAKISVSASDAEGMATVSGAAGAAEPLSAVAVGNLQTNQLNFTVAAADGSFALPLFAPPGSVLEIKHDATGRFVPQTSGANNIFEGATGTLVYVPIPAGTFSVMQLLGVGQVQTSLGVSEVIGNESLFVVRFTGAAPKRDYKAGDSISLSGTMSLFGKTPIADPAALKMIGFLSLFRYFDADGHERRVDNDFVSGILTPTGLPIGELTSPLNLFPNMVVGPLTRAGGHYEAAFTLSVPTPSDLPAGLYRPALSFRIENLPRLIRTFDEPSALFTINELRPPGLSMIRIGQPRAPKLDWVVGLDDFSNGVRGTIAVEDRGAFGIASHVITNTDTFILPMVEPRSGKRYRYKLEPFAPMLSRSATNGSMAEVPHVPLKFPSGTLRVIVTKPDGVVDDLGSAPFAQASLKTPVTRALNTIAGASNHVTDFLQLTTMDPKFDYQFSQYGLHRISMTGSIEDLDGNVYTGGGTYEVWVARTLDLDTGVIAGAPFEVGDAFSPAVVLQPGVAADVEVTVKIIGAPTTVTRRLNGRANRFGLFAPAEAMAITAAGEYRVDVIARYLDEQGVLWMGAMTAGGVVETPNSPLIAHGRRGFDLADGPQNQWFRVPDARTGGDHVMFPFHRGDIMWMSKGDPAADIPKISVQDPLGAFAARVRARSQSNKFEQPRDIEARITAGEIPLFSSTPPSKSAIEPEHVDQWAYFYAAASKPGVHVRELISGDFSGTGYWRFTGDNYSFQLGTGNGGDLPNDIKFQFGGAVYRNENDGFRWYGGYASLFVMLPDNDRVGRVFPPFQGNGGGPSGGPILRLNGKDVDLFFHLTALRPGSILVRGDNVSFAGHVAPTLGSKVDIHVIAPSGRERVVAGATNKFGWFYQPDLDFAADESGIWRVRVKVTNDGATSAGPLQPPFPTGDVLGSRNGEFNFYVVDGAAPPLDVTVPPRFPPLNQPIDFTAPGVELTTTVTAAGYILHESTTPSMRYTYDLSALSSTFPNLDRFDQDGKLAVDTVTLTFFARGADGKFRARQLTLQGEELQVPEQRAVPAQPRRRATHR
ncbi:MAG: hypothetical protein AABO58_16410 [Acidobacteriota bacterium]